MRVKEGGRGSADFLFGFGKRGSPSPGRITTAVMEVFEAHREARSRGRRKAPSPATSSA